MPAKKRPRTDSDATENASWTDDEVELLPDLVCSYSSQRVTKG